MVVQGVLRTAEAVTPMPGLVIAFLFFTALVLIPSLYYLFRAFKSRPA